jgi:hypothetical protein
MYYNCRGKFKVEQQIYEMTACNLPFNFIPKELLYVKNNSSKYELNITDALGMLCTRTSDGIEGLNRLGIVFASRRDLLVVNHIVYTAFLLVDGIKCYIPIF